MALEQEADLYWGQVVNWRRLLYAMSRAAACCSLIGGGWCTVAPGLVLALSMDGQCQSCKLTGWRCTRDTRRDKGIVLRQKFPRRGRTESEVKDKATSQAQDDLHSLLRPIPPAVLPH